MFHFIDTPLTHDALTAPDLTYTLIKPLEEKYANIQRKGNHSVVFCFLLNRVNFMRDQNLLTSSLSRTRASLCEIMATRLLRHYGDNMLQLAFVVTTTWRVYSGTDETLLKRMLDDLNLDDVEERVGNGIEMAIIGRAKRFIKSSACQRVIDSIWSGKCVYQAKSSHSILSDTYKETPIHFYDPHKAPLLDHYRLKVPAVRSVLEYFNFLVLFVLFVLVLEFNELNHLNWVEIVFMVYALGFTLEKIAAMQEHGLRVYITGTWNGFDLALITIFLSYASLRLWGFHYDREWARASGIDCLALAACLLFPRLAFVTLKNNLMVLSLRAMIIQFVFLMLIAAFCFAGFLYALWTLSKNETHYSAGDIFWWMADLWFGLDAAGFILSSSFHKYFGPLLMVSYACLSNTLLLTVLVSILSHTFASISEDAAQEAMFRRAVLTIEGVKADYLFSYQPPINVVALCIMLPASYILSPRWFHKFNVLMIRLTSFPILLTIAYYERQVKRTHALTFTEAISATAERVVETLPRSIKRLTFFEGLFAGKASDIDVIFDIENELANYYDSSALDMQDLDSTPSIKQADSSDLRRVSQTTDLPRRFSSQSNRQLNAFHSSASSIHSTSPITNNNDSNEETQPHRFRQRLASVFQRSDPTTNFTSPLAQIYQPLVVDDDLVESGEAPTTLTPSPTHTKPSANFLAQRRRRLSSMHRFPPLLPAPVDTQKQTHRDGNLFGGSMGESPMSLEGISNAEDSKEELGLGSPTQKQIATIPSPKPVSRVVGQETSTGSGSELSERLTTIEQNQKRLEELILNLTQTLSNRSTNRR